jgi:hypothetical protein
VSSLILSVYDARGRDVSEDRGANGRRIGGSRRLTGRVSRRRSSLCRGRWLSEAKSANEHAMGHVADFHAPRPMLVGDRRKTHISDFIQGQIMSTCSVCWADLDAEAAESNGSA